MLFVPVFLLAKQPLNLELAKKQIQSYVSSGEYEYDQWYAVKPALSYLIHHKFDNKSAIVFDIDETILSNYENMLKYGFGGNSEIFHENEMHGDALQISATKKLYDYAKYKGLHIFLLTGRGAKVAKATELNLKRAGFTGYEEIIFWQGKVPVSVKEYKSSSRCDIVKKGYKIIINVGDQTSDLVGPCKGEVQTKLPNPFYLIPADQQKRPKEY